MRIILIGQAAFAEKSLGTLRSKGEDVLAVFCPPDRAPDRLDPVKKRALELDVPVYQQRSMKGPEVLERFQALDADLAVLAFRHADRAAAGVQRPEARQHLLSPVAVAQIPRGAVRSTGR